jgi:hypothetical protein
MTVGEFQRFRPKYLIAKYGYHVVYLYEKDNLLTLLFNVSDFCAAELEFGKVIAVFNPFAGRWEDELEQSFLTIPQLKEKIINLRINRE